MVKRTRGVQRRRKGDEHEKDEVQEKVKEASDSVHTGEKNSMPSDAETGVGKSTVASVDGECRRARTNETNNRLYTAASTNLDGTNEERQRGVDEKKRERTKSECTNKRASERTNEPANQRTEEPRGSTRCSPRGRKERTSNAERTNGPSSSSRLCLLFLP